MKSGCIGYHEAQWFYFNHLPIPHDHAALFYKTEALLALCPLHWLCGVDLRQCHAVASSSLVSSAQIPLLRGSQGSYPQNKISGQARKRQSWSFPGRSLFQWRLKHEGAWFKKEKHTEKYKEHSRRGENYLKKYPTQVSLQNLYVRQW